MNTEFEAPTNLQKQRAAHFAERAKPGMTMDQYIRLNEEILRLFPVTDEERHKKFERVKQIPEFVL